MGLLLAAVAAVAVAAELTHSARLQTMTSALAPPVVEVAEEERQTLQALEGLQSPDTLAPTEQTVASAQQAVAVLVGAQATAGHFAPSHMVRLVATVETMVFLAAQAAQALLQPAALVQGAALDIRVAQGVALVRLFPETRTSLGPHLELGLEQSYDEDNLYLRDRSGRWGRPLHGDRLLVSGKADLSHWGAASL
jgi:hypothetical protein